MSAKSSIEWTDSTWSPLRVQVRKDAAEIARAKGYKSLIQIAEKMAGRVGRSRDLVEPFVDEKILVQPLHWKKPRRIFVENQSDLFGEWYTDGMIDEAVAVMTLCRQHTLQVLTKRGPRMQEYFSNPERASFIREVLNNWADVGKITQQQCIPACVAISSGPLANLWLGVSVEDQPRADERARELLQTPAAVRFLSLEPLLGPIDLKLCDHRRFLEYGRCGRTHIDWVIVGGESGPGARPMHPDWVRSIRDQCVAAGVPFFFKSWGAHAPATGEEKTLKNTLIVRRNPHERRGLGTSRPDEAVMVHSGKKKSGRVLDGRTWDEMPA